MSSTEKNVFVVGDSISVAYGPHLERMLRPRFGYARKTGQEPALMSLPGPQDANGGDSACVLAYLAAMCRTAWRPSATVVVSG